MELSSVSIIVAFLGVLTWFLYWPRLDRRNQKLPPGPYPFPVIGNIHQLGRNPNQTLAKLSKTYGPLMSLHLGKIYTVVASSPEMAREIMQKHDQAFSARIILASVEAHMTSMAFLPVGNQWRKFRKVTKEHMFTTSRLEASQWLRQEKLQKLHDFLKGCSETGRVVDIGDAVFVTTLNLMSSTLFSTEVTTFDSKGSQKFRDTFESLVESIGKPNLADYFPVLKPFDPQGIKRKSEFCLGEFRALVGDLINQRLESRISSSGGPKKTDLLETLLDLPQGRGDEYDLSMDDITNLSMDLFMGGQDAIWNTLEWAMAELLLNPNTLRKAKQELRCFLGEIKKELKESDISQLPYLRATLKETFRLHPPGPFLIPRKSEHDVQVSGDYVIPKDAQVLINVWAIGRDPAIWGPDTESFQPERFLMDKDIDLKGHDFELTPFGSGRRFCAGFTLAYRMVHMTLATLIHAFDWKLEVSAEEDYRREHFGIALRKAVPLKAIPIAALM